VRTSDTSEAGLLFQMFPAAAAPDSSMAVSGEENASDFAYMLEGPGGGGVVYMQRSDKSFKGTIDLQMHEILEPLYWMELGPLKFRKQNGKLSTREKLQKAITFKTKY
jgi:hypothetical protein